MLNVVTWFWGDKYRHEDVARLGIAVRRNLTQPHRFTVCVPEAEDEYLTKVKGCFVRLRMWDPKWQQAQGMKDYIACIDLDVVVTGELDPVFDRVKENFAILQGANASNPCPYNGSLMMLKAGTNAHVWEDFSLERGLRTPAYEFPDDQGWLSVMVPGATEWQAGKESGVYAFQKPGWPKGDDLPADARLVVFPGWRDPSKFTHLPWVKKHWSTAR